MIDLKIRAVIKYVHHATSAYYFSSVKYYKIIIVIHIK